MASEYVTKGTAIGIICSEVGVGRPTAEKALKELQASGAVNFITAGTAHMQLIARTEVEKVVEYLKSRHK
jgi:hypothetical protein